MTRSERIALTSRSIALAWLLLLCGCGHSPEATEPATPAAPATQIGVDDRPPPATMPTPKPSPELAAQVSARVAAYTAQARQQYDQTELTESQTRQKDTIIGLWEGTVIWRKRAPPRFDFDTAMLWALCFEVADRPEAPAKLDRAAQLLRLTLLAERAIQDKHFAVARVLLAERLLLNTEEDPADRYPYEYPRAFMLMGDHAGLCQWYRWHLHQRLAAESKRGDSDEPRAVVRVNQAMAERWMRLARMEGDGRALAAWARVTLVPDAPWLGGQNHGYFSYDPQAYQNLWRSAWQAWAFEAPRARQQLAQQQFLVGVERGWRERVVFEINKNTDRPHTLADASDASDAEFERCFALFRKRCPTWSIRSWGAGPFDADQARASQAQRRQAWEAWADSLIDADPVADMQAYFAVQERTLEHLMDLNRVDGFYTQFKAEYELARMFAGFDFDGLLAYERDRRKAKVHTEGGTWDQEDHRKYKYEQAVQVPRLEGDWELVLKLERRVYHRDAPPFGAEHYEAVMRQAAQNFDAPYFTWSLDRYLERRPAPRWFSP